MSTLEKCAVAALRLLPPEAAHTLALTTLARGLVPLDRAPSVSPVLRTEIAGMHLDSPIGLAAGFDKNCQALHNLAKAGFGFIEGGGVTLHPQSGNQRPRIFRITKEQAVINCAGFNNDGAHKIAQRLQLYAQTEKSHRIPLGINIGVNKDTRAPIDDFVQVLTMCAPFVDFVTLNVSSPNTKGLREWQQRDRLRALLASVQKASTGARVFLKIAPDLDADALKDIADIAIEARIDALIATNTTTQRTPAQERWPQGGLSGVPLRERSTRVLAEMWMLTKGQIPLIGVGGVDSAEAAYDKIKAGASAVQLYTALTYHGLSLVREMNAGLAERLQADGLDSLAAAVGTQAHTYS